MGDFWKEWNGKFRDDIRSFLKGDRGTIRKLACSLLGSGDISGEITPMTDPSIDIRLHVDTPSEESSAPCLSQILACSEIQFHGVRPHQQDWADDAHSLALTAQDPETGLGLHLMINAYWEPLGFELPSLPKGQQWHCWLDTSLPPRMRSSRGLKPHKFQASLTWSKPAQG